MAGVRSQPGAGLHPTHAGREAPPPLQRQDNVRTACLAACLRPPISALMRPAADLDGSVGWERGGRLRVPGQGPRLHQPAGPGAHLQTAAAAMLASLSRNSPLLPLPFGAFAEEQIGWTPLMTALRARKLRVVQLLVRLGANADYQDAVSAVVGGLLICRTREIA